MKLCIYSSCIKFCIPLPLYVYGASWSSRDGGVAIDVDATGEKMLRLVLEHCWMEMTGDVASCWNNAILSEQIWSISSTDTRGDG